MGIREESPVPAPFAPQPPKSVNIGAAARATRRSRVVILLLTANVLGALVSERRLRVPALPTGAFILKVPSPPFSLVCASPPPQLLMSHASAGSTSTGIFGLNRSPNTGSAASGASPPPPTTQ